MKKFIALAAFVCTFSGTFLFAVSLSDQERLELYRLGSYAALVVSTVEDSCSPDGGGLKVGDWCPDCTPNGKPVYPDRPGQTGDGRVFVTCGRCNGTQKVLPTDPCVAANAAESELNYSSMVEGARYPLTDEDILEEDEIIEDFEVIAEPKRMAGSKGNVEGKWSYDWDFIADHLRTVHNFDDVEGYSLEQLEIIHNNLHNGWPPFGCVKCSGSSSSSCPSGTCPSSGSAAPMRRGLFRRR